jgi:hypothetical protein
MASPRKKPTFIAGTPRASGDVQTGEFPITRGGGRVAVTVFSGGPLSPGSGFYGKSVKTADQLLLYSGPGRLNTIIPLNATTSGTALYFYDSITVARSGALPSESGYAVVGHIPANAIGLSPQLGGGMLPIQTDCPFQSGLCVACLSGTPGFTVTFTPESSITDDGTVTAN